MRNVAYKQRIAKYYDSRVKPRAFKVGDWVMRKVSLATKNPTEGTLGPTWEGPYEVTRISRPGAYQLRDSKGKTLPRPWNADHLKYYYKSSLQDSVEGASPVAGSDSGATATSSVEGLGEGSSPLVSKSILTEGLNLATLSSQCICIATIRFLM
ncbi:unnamed protein product [Prunus brigantina]